MDIQAKTENKLPVILLIDTSSTLCSVGLAYGENLMDCIESNNSNTHAEMLHVYISDLLKNNNLSYFVILII